MARLAVATNAQYLRSLHNQFPAWGLPLTLNDFLERESTLRATDFGKTLRCWVLVPAEDLTTEDFFCSCETFLRPLVVSSNGGMHEHVGYSIASVFTPPHHRRKGYAKTMMTSLHDQLALSASPPRSPLSDMEEHVLSWNGGRDGIASVLFSDIGPSYYAQCGTPGWTVTSPYQTLWSPLSNPASISPSVTPITLSSLPSISAADTSLLLSHPSPRENVPAFFYLPTLAAYTWHFTRSNTYAKFLNHSIPGVCGFEMNHDSRETPEWGFVVFTIDYIKSTVKILRFRNPVAGGQDLIDAVRDQGWILGCDKILGWNLPAELAGGKVVERTDSLPALAWYGEGKRLEWLMNEAFCWC